MDTSCLQQHFSVIETRHRSFSPWQRHIALMWSFLALRIAFSAMRNSFVVSEKGIHSPSLARFFAQNVAMWLSYKNIEISSQVLSFQLHVPNKFRRLRCAEWSIFSFRDSYFNQIAGGPRKAVEIKVSCLPPLTKHFRPPLFAASLSDVLNAPALPALSELILARFFGQFGEWAGIRNTCCCIRN